MGNEKQIRNGISDAFLRFLNGKNHLSATLDGNFTKMIQDGVADGVKEFLRGKNRRDYSLDMEFKAMIGDGVAKGVESYLKRMNYNPEISAQFPENTEFDAVLKATDWNNAESVKKLVKAMIFNDKLGTCAQIFDCYVKMGDDPKTALFKIIEMVDKTMGVENA